MESRAEMIPHQHDPVAVSYEDRDEWGEYQRLVDEYFDSVVPFWQSVYVDGSLTGAIYQLRRSVILSWIKGVNLPSGSRILEIGCGGGSTAVELARQSYAIDAIDTVERMVESTAQRAAANNVEHLVRAQTGDAHSLKFGDGTFDLVLAVGVIPWLHSPLVAVREIARVLKIGGYALLTCDNRWRLAHLADIRFNPLFGPVRSAAKNVLRSLGLMDKSEAGPYARMDSTGALDQILISSGLRKIKTSTLGFGPLTVWGHAFLSDRIGKRVHFFLQRYADQRCPLVRSLGAQYLVLAIKPAISSASGVSCSGVPERIGSLTPCEE